MRADHRSCVGKSNSNERSLQAQITLCGTVLTAGAPPPTGSAPRVRAVLEVVVLERDLVFDLVD